MLSSLIWGGGWWGFNFGLGFEVGFGWHFFFLLPCNSSSQAEAKKYGLKPNSIPNARAAELSLTLFGVLGANHFEDHKSHIV